MDNESQSPEKAPRSEQKNEDTDSDSTDSSKESNDTKKTSEKKPSDADKRRASFFDTKEPAEKQAPTRKPISEYFAANKTIEDREADKALKNEKDKLDSSLETDDTLDESSPEKSPEEGLTEAEATEATKALIDSRNEELEAELQTVEPDSSDEVEVLADVAFLESLRERLDDGEDVTKETINAAFKETAEDLGIEQSADAEDEFMEPTETDEQVASDMLSNNYEQDNEADETVEDDTNSQHNANSTQARGIPIPPTSPAPPLRPTANRYTANPHPPQPISSYAAPFNTTHHGGPNAQTTVVEYVERRRRGRDLLVGALVGYIIGRRGGRKRTEKKLMPKIETLEREVGELHDVITNHEDRIRTLARRTAEADARTKIATEQAKDSVDMSKTDSEAERKTRAHVLVENRQLRTEIKQTLRRREQLAEKESVEKLSKFTLPALNVFREKRVIDGTENSPKRKDFEVMTDEELLEKASHIRVDGVSVVEMYYARRLDRNGVLEVVKKYYRKGTGNYEAVFWKELKNDPAELEQKRQNLEQLHEKNGVQQPRRYEDTITADTVSNATDEQKQRFFQRYAGEDQQVAPQRKKNRTAQALILPWIAVVVFMAFIIVGYLLIRN